MARDSSRRQLRLSSPTPRLAISWIAIGSLVGLSLCKTTRAQDLVPAPPEMKSPAAGNQAPVFPPHFPEKIEQAPASPAASPSLSDELDRPFGLSRTNPFVSLDDPKKADSPSAPDRLTAAEQCLVDGEFGRALELFSLVIAYDHSSLRGHLGRARTLMAQGRYKLALEDVDAIITQDPSHLEAMQIRALCSMYLGLEGDGAFLETASTAVAAILAREPTDPLARAIRGVIATKKGDYNQGIAELSYAIKKQLQWKDKYYFLGLALMRKGDFRQAVAEFNNAARQYAASQVPAKIVLNRGLCAARAAALDLAIADFTTELERHGKDYRVFEFRAKAYVEKNDLVHALADRDEIVRLRPDDPQVYLERSFLRWTNGDTDLALADVDRVVQMMPQGAGAYFWRAVILVLTHGDSDRALADMDRAVALEPGNTFIYALRSYLRAQKLKCVPAFQDLVLCLCTARQHKFKITWMIDEQRGRFTLGFYWTITEDPTAPNPNLQAANADAQCIDWGVRRILSAAFTPAK